MISSHFEKKTDIFVKMSNITEAIYELNILLEEKEDEIKNAHGIAKDCLSIQIFNIMKQKEYLENLLSGVNFLS